MCQNNCNIKREKGEHLSYEDRVKIEHLYNQQDKNYTEIGEELNCHRTTVSREIKKGEIKQKIMIGLIEKTIVQKEDRKFMSKIILLKGEI